MLDFVQKRNPQPIAKLDQDATLVATTKRDALYSYKGGLGIPAVEYLVVGAIDDAAYGVS
jgi:hypothetical protein